MESMMFPHEKREALTHGRSPGNGTTEIPLSREPLATEGEATPGPDDYNPYDEQETEDAFAEIAKQRSPTAGDDDPYAYDDVDDVVGDLELPTLADPPTLSFDF